MDPPPDPDLLAKTASDRSLSLSSLPFSRSYSGHKLLNRFLSAPGEVGRSRGKAGEEEREDDDAAGEEEREEEAEPEEEVKVGEALRLDVVVVAEV